MKLLKSLLAIMLFITCLPLAAQTPAFDELEFEPDSIKAPYKPAGKNYVFVRSKRGTSGLNKTPAADAILSAEVTEIVLVFSELDPSSIADREEANRERWENLLKTYPEYFQFSTTYKNLCQCNNNGDSASFKKTQGFYVYVNGDVPKVAEETKVAATPPPAPPVTKTEAPKAAEPKKPEAKQPVAVVEKVAPVKEVAPPVETAVKLKEPPPVVEKQPVKETAAPAVSRTEEETPAPAEVKEPVKRKSTPVSTKPRRAKDPKACRPPCYGYGDEDLNAFFKENIPLTKKQRRKAKGWVANVRLQIHFDGAVKKVMVTGADEEFNKQLQDVLKNMNNWNSAVKNGIAAKSEVRFTVKYDGDTKAMKPFDVIANPKASPKCTCVSDGEMFPD